MPNNTDTNRRLLAARYRNAMRDASASARTPSSQITEAGGIGSAARSLLKFATKSKYPKRAPKSASIDEKMQYTADRAKALKAARDKAKAGEQAKKDKRLAKYNTKRAKAFDRAAARKRKADQRLKDKQSEARWQAQERADAEFNALKQMRQRQGRTR